MEKDGRVIIPVGAVLEGQVTEVHGGRQDFWCGGAASGDARCDAAGWDALRCSCAVDRCEQSEFNVIEEGT